jgi:DNA-binding MarR family transcriptional regulator
MSNNLREQLLQEVSREIAEFQSAADLVDEAASLRLGINRTDLRCLGLLFARGPLSAGQLAQASGLSPGATTTAIDRLEKAAYARRARNTGDRRGVMVDLTEQARRLIEDIYGPVGRAGMERLHRYTDEQLLLLRDFLREGQALQVECAAAIRSGEPPARS